MGPSLGSRMDLMNLQTSIIAAADFTAPGAGLLYQKQKGTHPAASDEATIEPRDP